MDKEMSREDFHETSGRLFYLSLVDLQGERIHILYKILYWQLSGLE
jgi:hypothetical protein